MPQYSHMMVPSSLWKESTLRSPLIASSRCVRSSTDLAASTTAGSSAASGVNGPLER